MSKNFSRYEFACKCGCGFAAMDEELIEVLEVVRAHFKGPVTITSGCRCPIHNAKVGGSKNSFHKLGMAADFRVRGADSLQVYNFLDQTYPSRYGIGVYESWVHLDVRPYNSARWSYKT